MLKTVFEFEPTDETLDQIKKATRQVLGILIEEALGENYDDTPYQAKAATVIYSTCKTIPAKAFVYTWLKGREDKGLQMGAEAWAAVCRKEFFMVQVHMMLFVLYHEIRNLFTGMFGGINLNPLH